MRAVASGAGNGSKKVLCHRQKATKVCLFKRSEVKVSCAFISWKKPEGCLVQRRGTKTPVALLPRF